MTNAQLIHAAKQLNGITEEAHTFAHWKELGYVVRKGEHAAFKCSIWKYRTKLEIVEDEEVETGNMFLKMAHFFTKSQVDELKGKEETA